ncbi:MAG: hypothetical protein QXF48_03340 [Candidatus Anstonellaceae archaeon]
MYNNKKVEKNKMKNKMKKEEIIQKFQKLKEKIENEKNLGELTKLVYKISSLARRDKKNLENINFEILNKIYLENKDRGYSFLVEGEDQKPSDGHWLIKAIVINIISIKNDRVDEILNEIINDQNMTWSIRTSALTGLYLRGLKMGKEKNIEILNNIVKNEKDPIVKSYAKKYSLGYKIIKENGFKESYQYWQEYIQSREFNSVNVIKNVQDELKELKINYYLF